MDEPVEGTSLAFGDLMAQVEETLNNPNADKDDLERAKDLAEAVNSHDKTDPDCDTKIGKGTKTKGWTTPPRAPRPRRRLRPVEAEGEAGSKPLICPRTR